jgi:hypothetical protein
MYRLAMKFKAAFVRWVEERGMKWVFVSEKTGVPYGSLMFWKSDQQPLADAHLYRLWIFTGKSICKPTYRHPITIEKPFVYPDAKKAS